MMPEPLSEARLAELRAVERAAALERAAQVADRIGARCAEQMIAAQAHNTEPWDLMARIYSECEDTAVEIAEEVRALIPAPEPRDA